MEFELVRRFGVRVVEVEQLPRALIYLHRYDLAFVNADLNALGRAVLTDRLLGALVQPRLPSDRS